jgi:tRNA ligase
MKHHTQAPYHLTLKSNGCLILISALSPNHLVVASKHSLGTTTEAQAEEAIADGVNKLSVKGEKGKGKEKVKEAMDEHSEAQQHAEVGRMWLSRTLNKSGKREEDLARQLWDQNLTAVLEVRRP